MMAATGMWLEQSISLESQCSVELDVRLVTLVASALAGTAGR